MRIDVIRYEPHTLTLRPFKFFFQRLYWFLQLRSCFIKWYEKEQSIKFRPFRIHNGARFETLNLLHVSSCEMFTFCDVLHETKQKTQTNYTDWKSSLTKTVKHLQHFLMDPECWSGLRLEPSTSRMRIAVWRATNWANQAVVGTWPLPEAAAICNGVSTWPSLPWSVAPFGLAPASNRSWRWVENDTNFSPLLFITGM